METSSADGGEDLMLDAADQRRFLCLLDAYSMAELAVLAASPCIDRAFLYKRANETKFRMSMKHVVEMRTSENGGEGEARSDFDGVDQVERFEGLGYPTRYSIDYAKLSFHVVSPCINFATIFMKSNRSSLPS